MEDSSRLFGMLLVLAAVVLFALRRWSSRPSSAAGKAARPPAVPGLFLLGNAVSLGRWGAGFLAVCRDAFGPDAFLIDVGFGQKMLFLFHPALLEAFFKAPEEVISFKPAVRRFTQRWVLVLGGGWAGRWRWMSRRRT